MANATFQPGYNGNIWVDHPDFLPLCTRVLAANWNIRRHCPIAVSSVYSFEYKQKNVQNMKETTMEGEAR